MMKLMKLCALLIAMTVLAAGCGAKQPENSKNPDKPFRIANAGEPETLDPRKASGTIERIVLGQIFEGLCAQNAQGEIIPGAAERWEISPDGLVYKFYLRPDAKWSNGDPVTAGDFEYSWLSTLDPKLGSKYAEMIYHIKNGEAYNNGKAPASAVGIKALDERTLEITLENPAPYFPFLTSFFTYYPVHKKTVEENPNWNAEPATIIGNGPFKMVNWVHNNKIELIKNDNYWNREIVKLNKVEINLSDSNKTVLDLFENKQLETAETRPPLPEIPRLIREGKLKILPHIGTYYYCLNTAKPPFDNVKVRKAFALAINRKDIVELITKSGEMPALAWAPYGLPDVKKGEDFRKIGGDYFKDNDVETARRLLAEAGYPDGKGLPPVTLLYNNSDVHKVIAEAVQEMWKKNLGVTVSLTNQEWKVYAQSLDEGNFQIARSSWLGEYLDPMTFADTLTSSNGNNHTRWKNQSYDELVKTAKKSIDPTSRMKAMHDAEKLLMNDMPVIPIYFYTSAVLEQPTVKGVIRDAFGSVYLREASY